MSHRRIDATRCLFEIAAGQDGFFTTRQAIAAGYSDATHPYHVRSGSWIRELRGIYRLALFPSSARPDLMRWYLWSNNRQGEPQGVFSHETALSLFELTDLNPAHLHLTVPVTFRRRVPTPRILVLHRAQVDRADVTTRNGVPVTRPLRTISDLNDRGDLDVAILRQAFAEATKRGIITLAEADNARAVPHLRALFD